MTFRFSKGQWNAVAVAIVVLLAFAVLLGGASRQHALRLALVELAALPLLVMAGGKLLADQDFWDRHRLVLGLILGIAATPLLQLIPLPPAIWTALPGRDPLVLSLTLANIPAGWSALSLTPEQTWRAFLALIPPIAMFTAVLTVPAAFRRLLVYLLLAFVTAAIMLGVLQLVSGRFYPWATTAPGNMVGFFANRNHLATLLLLSLPFAAAILGGAFRRRTDQSQIALWLSMSFMGLVVIALGVIRSRTGVVLVGPALVASFVIAWIAGGRGRPKPQLLAVMGAVAVAMAAVGIFALGPIMDRFDPDAAPEGRSENWPTVVEAAQTYLPVGSGLGSFDPVYRSVEPLERLDATFFNQAHNDYLETWLETGWIGIGLLIVFLVWWGRRSWSAFKAPTSRDTDIQRAASIAMLMVMIHSAVDYPLRTETIAVIFALCAALLEGGALAIEAPSRRRRT